MFNDFGKKLYIHNIVKKFYSIMIFYDINFAKLFTISYTLLQLSFKFVYLYYFLSAPCHYFLCIILIIYYMRTIYT